MNSKDFDIVSSQKFVEQYMGVSGAFKPLQSSAVQSYLLSEVARLIYTPSPLFRAEYNFLLIFSSGGGVQQVYNEFFELKANDVLFIREGHLNAIQSIAPDTKGYFIHIDSKLLPQVFLDQLALTRLTFSPKLTLSTEDSHWLCKCVDLIHQLKPGAKTGTEIGTALLRAMFLRLTDIQHGEAIPKPDRHTAVNLAFKELLYEHFREKRAVEHYAQALSVSANYLDRCVKAVTGKSPKQHISEVVIYYSQILLQNSAKDISQVAFELNFSDPGHFGRLFKQVTGTTPSEYRDNISHGLSEHRQG